jgi:exopolyphosphatase/pppGpp-phosphohydrolase
MPEKGTELSGGQIKKFGVAMHNPATPIRAAIDIGSNTIHLVIAKYAAFSLDILVDEEEMVRIGESVNATGLISAEKHEASIALLQKYVALARRYDAADPILVVATEAIRRARNSREFLDCVLHETGLTVHLIEGNAEATLTFLGATYEVLSSSPSSDVLSVLDLGGGSMELAVARQRNITWQTSVSIGSGWLHDRYLLSDPATVDDVETANTFLGHANQGDSSRPHCNWWQRQFALVSRARGFPRACRALASHA